MFRLVALAIPLLPLLAGELVLRTRGYGGYPPVLQPLGTVDGRTWYGTNQAGLSTFFFQQLTTVGSMEEQVFVMPKEPGTVRVMILGESAARGYPHPKTRSAAGFYRAMLEDVIPDRKIEVINLGTTAIASFAVREILGEALAFDPDLVIVYCGNNEFFGAQGVASVHSFGRSTAAMRAFRIFRSTALGQWITELTVQRKPVEGDEQRARTLMEQVIGQTQIGPDDSKRTAAVRNLENHVRSMVSMCGDAGVPVVVCTLPANERDLAPIGVDLPVPLDETRRSQFEELLRRGRELVGTDAAGALSSLVEAERLHAKHAALQFAIAGALTALGRDEEARAHYQLAREYDPMPWRAPGTVSAAARRAAADGAILCDLDEAFRLRSPGGSVGWALMDDHVHPSLAGQALIAAMWLGAMEKLEGPLHVESSAIVAAWTSSEPAGLGSSGLPVTTEESVVEPGRAGAWQAYAAKLGDNLYDRYGVAHRMLTLLRAPFYRANNEAALARFEAICATYEAQMPPVAREAAVRWQDPRVHHNAHRPITGMVGQALLAAGRYEDAEPLLMIAREQVSKYSVWTLELTWDVLKCRQQMRPAPLPGDVALVREMVTTGETFIKVTGTAPRPIRRYIGLAAHLMGDYAKAVEHLGDAVSDVADMSGFEVVSGLADSLVRTGQEEKARRLLSMPVRDEVLAAACREMLETVGK